MTLTLPATDAQVAEMLDAYKKALGPQDDAANQDPVWGNADALVMQWRGALGDEGSDALLLGIRIRRVAMLLDKIIIQECSEADVKNHEFILLMALRRIGEPYALRPSDILKMHSVTSGTATYRLDQLSKRDLVQRIPDPSDRRSFLIGLTPHGKEVVDTILGRMRGSFDAQLAPFHQVPGGFDLLEAGLRLFESCIQASPAQGAAAK
ncbi:MarR family transcriptional regulator [Paucibacter sp. PLA-PC-4]|uniref:MarR family winged helix-turn-helix transcriptional regulator n=1 Tax=Paucibacter sp. PLA-PC-4 TaxID=2993655 RepID=UPI00224A79AB|nr:MarR family transcriptional regulator [Paucibacter sp. PLA-PC-4]MCX2863577.1 MarR family transcriptional regulator [Paucibacter sp. PLA-PC-4]